VTNKANARPRWALLSACIFLGTVAVIAWWLPSPKNNVVLGRFDYPQFWLVVLSSSATLSAFTIAAVPPRFSRRVGFRLVAIWIGGAIGLLLLEGVAFFLPVRSEKDNPWYHLAGGGVSGPDELPFGRPPHLKWLGLSRGDLAQMNGDTDPYARTITFETDMDGFHNSRDIREADIVTIGDSFAEAGNVFEAEGFSRVLGQRLGWRTRNLGRAGYGPPLELIVLRRYGIGCHPKVIVWQIAESNDLEDSFTYKKWVAGGRRPRLLAENLDRGRKRTIAWQQHSPTFRLFQLLLPHAPPSWPYRGIFRDATGTEHPIRFLKIPDLNASAQAHPGWSTFAKALAEGAELCRSNRIQLLIVLVPDKYRVLGPYTRMSDPTMSTEATLAITSNALNLGVVLESYCKSLNVHFVDATLSLKNKAQTGELVYLPYDTHLSPLGHQVIADLIVAELRSANVEKSAR
jgi:hypothetical protein